MFAKSTEKMVRVYETQSDEINNLTQKLTALQSEGKAEGKRLWATLKKFDKILEVTIEVLEKIIEDLRSRERYQLPP